MHYTEWKIHSAPEHGVIWTQSVLANYLICHHYIAATNTGVAEKGMTSLHTTYSQCTFKMYSAEQGAFTSRSLTRYVME